MQNVLHDEHATRSVSDDPAVRPRDRSRRPSRTHRLLDQLPAAVVLLVLSPVLLTNRAFGHDWTVHLWALRQQELNIQKMGHPGLFLSAEPFGAFHPFFAFVGSGLYTLGGYLAIALGDRPILAYKLLFVVGVCLAYGGLLWSSVQAGLRGWRAHIPSVVLVTGAYFLTDMLGRGDFGEFMAVCSIPFLVAAASATFTARRVSPRHVLSVVFGVFLLTGSHTITLLWGTIFMVFLAVLAGIAFVRPQQPRIPWRNVGALILGAGVGGGLNAWYLFPDLAFGFKTQIALWNKAGFVGLDKFVHPAVLLNPLRPSNLLLPPILGDIRVALPWMFGVWALGVGAVLWGGRDRATRTFFVGLIVLAGFYLVFVLTLSPWKVLPHLFYNTQFPWRLHSYVLLVTAFLVMVALVWQSNSPAGRFRRAATPLILLIVAFNVGVATWQVWRTQSIYSDSGRPVLAGDHFVDTVVASRYTAPPSWYTNPISYNDNSATVVAVDTSRNLTIPVRRVHGERFSGVVDVPDGRAPFTTNLSANVQMIHVTGIEPLGRSANGFLIAVRPAGAPAHGPLTIKISPAHNAVMRDGRWLSVASLFALLGLLLWPVMRLLRSRRPRRSGHGSRPSDARAPV